MTRTTGQYEPFPGPQPAGDGATRRCQWGGCLESGEYRAPTDKTLTEYYVFCLEHVRSYNAQWNFHDGMNDDEMEQEFRSAATWDRPTWKFGERHAPGRPWHGVYDPFDVFKESPGDGGKGASNHDMPVDEHNQARHVLGLQSNFTMKTLKARYKVLVKQHHPDANGGAPEAENRMKVINAAYHTLRASLTS